MTPDFRIEVDGVDLTPQIRRRLLSLAVTDEAGEASDRVELKLDDRGLVLAMPRKGVKMRVWLGYAGQPLQFMGAFVVDEVGHEGPPATMVIRAKGADMLASLKARKTASWHDYTLGEIVAQIAKDHGLTPLTSPKLAGEKIAHIDQTDESDLHFLTRLAKDRDAVCKPANGHLLFVPKGEAKTATGKTLPRIAVPVESFREWNYVVQERDAYRQVIAYWQDKAGAARTEVRAGAGDPIKRLRHTYATESEAQGAADAELRRIQRGQATLNLVMPGRPELMAEARALVSDLKPDIDGEWSITRAEHTLTETGLETHLETETPQAET